MAIAPATDASVRDVLDACERALRSVAEYELEPELERRMRDLGERKEFLDPGEHDELMGLVAFARRRATETLEAKVALGKLRGLDPDLARGS